MKLEKALKMAKEYEDWNAGHHDPGVTGEEFVAWVDQRKLVYDVLHTRGYELLHAGIVDTLRTVATHVRDEYPPEDERNVLAEATLAFAANAEEFSQL